ncbi:MAG: hypothetical protein SFW66_00845 [Gammaproteobacteria bacterium]|nr:hypothetical protein [Gammaproteobacteria bacterium]
MDTNSDQTIHDSLTQKMTFSDILQEAWKSIDGIKWRTLVLFIFYVIATIATQILSALFLVAIIGTLFPNIGSSKLFITIALTLPYAIFFIFPAFFVWIVITMLLNKTLARPYTIEHARRICFSKFKKLVGLSFIIGLLSYVGDILPSYLATTMPAQPTNAQFLIYGTLLFVVGAALFYLMFPVYLFSGPLLIFRDKSISEAFFESYEIMSHYWGLAILGLVVLFLVVLASVCTLGIFLIWGLPFTMMYFAILCREACGLRACPQLLR